MKPHILNQMKEILSAVCLIALFAVAEVDASRLVDSASILTVQE